MIFEYSDKENSDDISFLYKEGIQTIVASKQIQVWNVAAELQKSKNFKVTRPNPTPPPPPPPHPLTDPLPNHPHVDDTEKKSEIHLVAFILNYITLRKNSSYLANQKSLQLFLENLHKIIRSAVPSALF